MRVTDIDFRFIGLHYETEICPKINITEFSRRIWNITIVSDL